MKNWMYNENDIIKLFSEAQYFSAWPGDGDNDAPTKWTVSKTQPDAFIALFKELGNLKGNLDKVLGTIGGDKTLTANYTELKKNMDAYGTATERIDMPVVEPKDILDLKQKIDTGKLDLVKPFAGWGEHQIKEMFPRGLNTQDQKVKDFFMVKGDEDGNDNDDKAVKLSKGTAIAVNTCRPTQDRVYADKISWNVLRFGATKPGGVAHGDANIIAVQVSANENYILDGHHRWAAAYLSGGNTQINVRLLTGLPKEQAIEALRSYGNARGNEQKE